MFIKTHPICFKQYIETGKVPQILKKKQSAKHKSAKKQPQKQANIN